MARSLNSVPLDEINCKQLSACCHASYRGGMSVVRLRVRNPTGGRAMYRSACVLALAAALAAGGAARASDPIGGYLIVDKVVLEPADSPTTIQIWGSVALCLEQGGRKYADPVRGYLYYKAPS